MLNDVEGVIIKVVEDDALSDSEVLVGVLNNWLLEIGEEFKNLKIKVYKISFTFLIKTKFLYKNSNFIFQFYMDKYNIIEIK